MDTEKPTEPRRWRLRFEPGLEREYLAAQGESARRWVRMSTLVALSTVLGFAVIDHWVVGYRSNVPNIVRYGLQLPLVLIALAFTSRRLYGRWYQPAIQVSAPIFGLGIVVMAVYAPAEQVPLVGARLLLVTFFFYFMLAMPFGAALRSNLIVMLAYLGASVGDALPSAAAIYQLFALFCANLIGGAGCYVLEHANRKAFLERRRLVEVAARDGLTGLFNRAAFEERIHLLWRQATREAQPMTVIMIDIDHFKAYNDQYGHQAGDACLRSVSRAVDTAMVRRPLDFVARYGGEELVAVLYGADRVYAEEVARTTLAAVANLGIDHLAAKSGQQVSVSMGVATHSPPLEASHDRAVKLADRALYTAKRQGRDRYVAIDVRLTTDAAMPAGSDRRQAVV
ncbi:MAG TPA: diguanylate cyclase [Steroidobacteraceae bacterium]|nr:diguanylate cyclase [Steroidobacteraceae bacterium]